MTLYQIDAFTDHLFGGNPAAVIPLEIWIDDTLMQKIALENNLSDTAFFIPAKDQIIADFEIRWFTPKIEINLCGHATLASAFVLFNILNFNKPEINFLSQSGVLKATRNAGHISMDFPSWEPVTFNDEQLDLKKALGGIDIISVHKKRDLLIELQNEESVKNCTPDFSLIYKTGHKIIITAPGTEVDFVSRFFAPTAGIDEDPVTGSAHSHLIPFWSKKLNKSKLIARQLSERGGQIYCEQNGNRVTMAGQCVFYMKGEIEISKVV